MERERVGRFLRTLVGLFTVAWLVVALFVPPAPLIFLLWLVPSWGVATLGAIWLVYFGGNDVLRASAAYAPRAPASQATAAFVGLVVVLKLLATAGTNALLGASNVGHAVGVVTSTFALVVAYVVVFWAGALGWFRGDGSPARD